MCVHHLLNVQCFMMSFVQVNICKANMRLEACVRTGEPAHIVESFEQLLQYKVRATHKHTRGTLEARASSSIAQGASGQIHLLFVLASS